MKRYYDLNNAAENEYDPVARRGEVEPDFSFVAQSSPKRRFDKSIQALSKNKNRGLQSLSPSARKGGKAYDYVVDRNQNSIDMDEKSDALGMIYANLIEVKQTIRGRQKGSPDERLKKIYEIVDSTLRLKLFKKEKAKAKPVIAAENP